MSWPTRATYHYQSAEHPPCIFICLHGIDRAAFEEAPGREMIVQPDQPGQKAFGYKTVKIKGRGKRPAYEIKLFCSE